MKILKIIFVLTSIFLASCAGFERIALFQGNKKTPLGEPALSYNKGNLTKLKWKANSPDNVEVVEEGIVLTKDNSKKGNRNTHLYLDVEDIDFRGDLAVVIRAKIEDGEAGKLRLELIDDEGHLANGKDLTNLIRVTNDYVEYTYKTEGSFTQLVPELADVNSANIKQIRFVFAPASKNHKGTLKISDIQIKVGTEAAPKKNLGPTGKKGGLIADFSKGIKGWSAKGPGLSVNKGKKSLRIDAVDVGPAYQSITSKVELMDLSEHSIIKVRAKVLGGSHAKPFLRLDVEDVNRSVSNKFPVWLKLDGETNKGSVTVEGSSKANLEVKDGVVQLEEVVLTTGSQFVDYYFNLKGRFYQSYPKTLSIDEKRINRVTLYLNPGYNRYSGQVYIQSIEAIQ